MNKIFIICLIFFSFNSIVFAQKTKVVHRAKPPVFIDKGAESQVFFKNAFSELGERPVPFVATGNQDQSHQPQPPKVDIEFDRSSHMKTISTNEDSISEILSSKAIFSKQINRLDDCIEGLILTVNKMKQSDPMFEEDADYQKHMQQFYRLIQTMKEDAQNNNYEKTRFSFNKLKQSCDACHTQFR